MSALFRLIYASDTALPLDPQTVQNLLDVAKAHNQRHHITGLLVFNANYFLQVLEGDRAVVNALYHRIAHDPRHHRLTLLSAASVPGRDFAPWSMEFVAADKANKTLFEALSGQSHWSPHDMTAQAALALLMALRPSVRD